MTIPYAEVIGDPIAHSKSPLIHGFWLKALGLAGTYRQHHVTAESLGDYLKTRAADENWRGCNVTIPHKRAVMDFVEDGGNLKDSIGAMNCILRQRDGSLVGTNTDAAGFYAPIADLALEGAHVTVIGAGGAARAVLFALAQNKVGSVTLLNRNRDTAQDLLCHFGLRGKAAPLDTPIPPSSLIVNASSLGMVGMPAFAPDLSHQSEDCVVYDIVYSPLITPLLAEAQMRDLAIVDGLEMLIGQAAVAFALLFGSEPPRDQDDTLRALLTS